MTDIILSTLNAKYIHASLGLRYIHANLGPLESKTQLIEFTIENRPIDIAEKLLQLEPRIIGFGVYIWNVNETFDVVRLIKAISPSTVIVLGGPEVSYEQHLNPITKVADYVICGPGDIAFKNLCQQILDNRRPIEKIIKSSDVKINDLEMPYKLYSDEDIKNRVVYVEASRGCPFKCEFCLSSLDKTAWPFKLERFLNEMEALYNRGLRNFKFVDRTFNLNVKTTTAILEFFLSRLTDDLFLHFELIPDHLPDALKTLIQRFPPGCLQFEIGIQTFNPDVQSLISRKQKNERSAANLLWLAENTHAHIHADLIFGLPGDNLTSFAQSFNQLVQLKPHEIQVGILKRLKGSPIIRHTDSHGMVYNPSPPFNVLRTSTITFDSLQRVNRFARYWDMIGNSGRFSATLPLILFQGEMKSECNAFERFLSLTDWLFEKTGQTHKISLSRLFDLLFEGAQSALDLSREEVTQSLMEDYQFTHLKSLPKSLGDMSVNMPKHKHEKQKQEKKTIPPRQARHMRSQ